MTTLQSGDPAPTFALRDQHGETVRLEDFGGRKRLVYFYPEADTPGCTTQSCDLRDHRKDFWGTWTERSRDGETFLGILRSSFLVAGDGRIERTWCGVTPTDTVPNALAALAG